MKKFPLPSRAIPQGLQAIVAFLAGPPSPREKDEFPGPAITCNTPVRSTKKTRLEYGDVAIPFEVIYTFPVASTATPWGTGTVAEEAGAPSGPPRHRY